MVSGHKSSFFRSGLVVFQFTISIALITATLALYRQMTFIQNHKLGFDKEGIIVMRDVKNAGEKLFAFRDKVLENSFVHTATISSYLPGPGSARKTPLAWKFGESPSPENSINLEQWEVDYEYAPTLGLEIIEGRNFSMDFPSDSSAVILNEAAVQNLGLVQPVGARISLAHENPDGSQTEGGIETWTIIGVVRNFNFESLRQNVGPLGLFFGTHSQQSIAFRYEAGQESRLIEVLREEWKEAAAGEPFNYTFFDQNLQSLYGTEQRLGRIFIMFSVLAIVIACLGLFALTAFSAEQRTKEIGIRKVLGASARSIVLLLSWQLSKLVVIGFVIAAPLAAYGIDWYLQQYAYRTEISVWLYGWAGLIALLLAFLTMAYQSSRAALSNPIDALKSE
jgi:putative ABC transport system permease protein